MNGLTKLAAVLVVSLGTLAAGFFGRALFDQGYQQPALEAPAGQVVCVERADGKMDCVMPAMPLPQK